MEVKKEEIKRKHTMLIPVILTTVVFAALIIPLLLIKPKLTVDVDQITIPVGSPIPKINYKATYMGIDVSKYVSQNTILDTNEIGTYTLSYNIETGFNYINKDVILNIVDTIAPEIQLKGTKEIEVCDDAFNEPGYSATDNYDGDLTKSVTVTKNNKSIIYQVSDSSGNETTVSRKIIDCSKKKTKEKETFTITLNGSETLYIPLGTEYVEYGAKAVDSIDGEVTVTINGSVDINTAGHYSIIYTATNSQGKTISKARNIYVFDPETSQNLIGDKNGVIYLTFDDGPSAYTEQILNILDKYNIKATFFVTNSGSDAMIKQEYDRGHTVALHTATHQWSIYSSKEAYFKDLETVSNRVERITGVKSMIIRFPGGSSNTVSRNYKKGIMTTLTSEVLKRGYHYFDWNVCVEDAGACTKKKTYQEKMTCVKSYFKSGLSKTKANVVLLHDIKKYSADSLEEMIQYAIKEGYTFEKITMETTQIHSKVNN
jgi:peptidoglycan/xylan/chitin deacetylase (PgdA/CDA1 family)